jgi:FkbM family methyltransferase
MHPIHTRSLAQRVRDRLARDFDLRLVHWMRLGDTQQAWYLRRLFRLLDIDLVVDVGGNFGQYATLLRRRVGYRGALISVEPMPVAATALRRRFARDARWALAECALGEQPGTATLNVLLGHEMSSLLPPSSAVTDGFEPFQRVRQQVEVEVRTLDALLASQPLARAARHIYLKLDVQGFELQVLRGATASLPRIDALQAEASVVPLYEGVPPYHALMAEIEAMGFQLSFLPAHNYTQVPDMVDFDCHFVARRCLVDKGYLRAQAKTS